jgi:raffinose/stachyose/melibiose transport system substrate-binding protein
VALRGPDQRHGRRLEQAIELSRQKHPGVTVKFEEKGFEQIQQNAQMILNSNRRARHHGVQQGQRDRRPAVQAGPAHRPEHREATKRGWDKKLSAGLQTTAKYDAAA